MSNILILNNEVSQCILGCTAITKIPNLDSFVNKVIYNALRNKRVENDNPSSWSLFAQEIKSNPALIFRVNPPHFYVEYQGHQALMTIESGEIIAGTLPNKAIKLVREWAKEHQQELLNDWQCAIDLKPLQRIPGADND